MIYDCFNFFNELELLELRFNELNKVVDKFVLVESTVTFTNHPKPLYFQKNKHLFKEFQKKIIHVVVKDSPNVYGNPWIIENFQLSAVIRGLKNAKQNDTILISCVDEIPNPDKILEWKNKPGKHKVFMQDMYYYFLNFLNYNSPPWEGTRMFKYDDLKTYPSAYIARFSSINIFIPHGGWHFSFIGGVERIRKKIFSYSHQEYNNPKYNTPEKIMKSIINGEDLFNQGHKFKMVENSQLPKYVQDHLHRFKKNLLNINPESSIKNKMTLHVLDLIGIGRNIIRSIRNKKYLSF